DFPGDASPAEIVIDLLSNSRYGAGFPLSAIDSAGSLADWATYCRAALLAMSILMDRPQPAARWIEYICRLSASAPVWSCELLKIIPYATGPVSGNGASWTPNLAPLYTLSDDDFIRIDAGGDNPSDPVRVARPDPQTISNWLSLEYYDAVNSYNPNVVPVFDQ